MILMIIAIVVILMNYSARCCHFLKSCLQTPCFHWQMVPKELSRELWPFQEEGLDRLLSDRYGWVEDSLPPNFICKFGVSWCEFLLSLCCWLDVEKPVAVYNMGFLPLRGEVSIQGCWYKCSLWQTEHTDAREPGWKRLTNGGDHGDLMIYQVTKKPSVGHMGPAGCLFSISGQNVFNFP